MSYSIVWKRKKAWNVMYQVKISHRHSPLASQPSLSFSLVWHIPKVQTLEQFHRWTWNVVMSMFNALICNTNTSFSNITLHYSHNILYLALGRVLTITLIIFLLIWHQMSRKRNAESLRLHFHPFQWNNSCPSLPGSRLCPIFKNCWAEPGLHLAKTCVHV